MGDVEKVRGGTVFVHVRKCVCVCVCVWWVGGDKYIQYNVFSVSGQQYHILLL